MAPKALCLAGEQDKAIKQTRFALWKERYPALFPSSGRPAFGGLALDPPGVGVDFPPMSMSAVRLVRLRGDAACTAMDTSVSVISDFCLGHMGCRSCDNCDW